MKLLERRWKERRTQIETLSAASLPLMTGGRGVTTLPLKTVKSIIKSV